MLKELSRNFIFVGIMKVVAIPITIIASAILARELGPNDFGLVTFAISTITVLFTAISSGGATLVIREISDLLATKKNWPYIRGLIRLALIWIVVVSLIIILITIIISNFIYVSNNQIELVAAGIYIVLFAGITKLIACVLKAQKKPVASELPTLLLQPAIILIAYSFLIYLNLMTSKTAILANVLAYVVSLVVALYFYKKFSINFLYPGKYKYKLNTWKKPFFQFSIQNIAAILNSQIGIIILGVSGLNDAVSGFSIAERAGQFVSLSLLITNMNIAPYLVESLKHKRNLKLKMITRFSARLSFFIALPITLVLVIKGESIIEFIFGSQYISLAYIPMVIIVISQLFNVGIGSVGNLLNLSGNEKTTLSGMLYSLILNITLCIFLIPKFGVIGAACSVASSTIFWNLYLHSKAKKILGVSTSIL
jgi:O-antigen/teichoic acid export membrane protein